MGDGNWRSGPLWRQLCLFQGITVEDRPDLGLTIYERMENLISDENAGCEFLSTLTLSQYSSWQLIQEWWSCSIEEDEWFCGTDDKSKELQVLQNFQLFENVSPVVLNILFKIEPPLPRFSSYRLQLHQLFLREFDPQEWDIHEEDRSLGALQQVRERAAFYASVQRTTFPFRESGMRRHPNSPVSILKRPLSACVEPCPWLRFRRDKAGHPFYLWDSFNCRTVVVSKLDFEPEYVCISHTWGRWREEDRPGASIPGVPWLVPRNRLYEVEDLPRRLKAAELGRYIWFDLFCIPQDGSERASIEIARQATIFGNATNVVSWLNHISDWSGMRLAVEWLSLFCLTNQEAILRDSSDTSGTMGTGLVLPDLELQDDEAQTPTFWFTSLWTLQEACLRPDMFLCNQNFEPLTVGESKSAMTLDGLVALMAFATGMYNQGPYETIENWERLPDSLRSGTVFEFADVNRSSSKRSRRVLRTLPKDVPVIHEIYDALTMSGMMELFRLSPVSIIYLGSHRQCTSNRAEAVMSAIGATKWYNDHLEKYKKPPPQDDLVLGHYPLTFLQEVANLLGARFFTCVSSDLGNLETVVDFSDGQWIVKDSERGIGSLLPFTSDRGVMMPQAHDSTVIRDHESTQHWRILRDGSVEVRKAAIISSSGRSYTSELSASVRVPQMFSPGPEEQVDLHEWIRTFRVGPQSHNFAVSVFQPTKKFQSGIILKQVGKNNRLVKMGNFFTAALTIDEVLSEEVDWIVL